MAEKAKTIKKTTVKVAAPKKAVVKAVKAPKTEAVEKSVEVDAKASKNKVTAKVFDLAGKATGSVTLADKIFKSPASPVVVSQAVRVYLANQRAGTAKTKTRGQVKGSTRKIYRQKGTGKARHGAITAPLFVGGGIAFGPVPHDFSLKMPQKARQKALFAALTDRAKDDNVVVLDVEKSTGRSKEIATAVKGMGYVKKGKAYRVLFVAAKEERSVRRSAHNLSGVDAVYAFNLSVYEVVKNLNVIFSRKALEELENTYFKK